ncbi:hypothetical protein E5CHR_00129 [Variovorax sp. PBL-E5]|nr:hypothetical protein E5CHR_00129 [Variovorax sp. PBL-E5]
MAAISGITLADINDAVGPGIASAEAAVKADLAAASGGTALSVAQLTQLQFDEEEFTIIGSIYSALLKELSDLLKSIVQKM